MLKIDNSSFFVWGIDKSLWDSLTILSIASEWFNHIFFISSKIILYFYHYYAACFFQALSFCFLDLLLCGSDFGDPNVFNHTGIGIALVTCSTTSSVHFWTKSRFTIHIFLNHCHTAHVAFCIHQSTQWIAVGSISIELFQLAIAGFRIHSFHHSIALASANWRFHSDTHGILRILLWASVIKLFFALIQAEFDAKGLLENVDERSAFANHNSWAHFATLQGTESTEEYIVAHSNSFVNNGWKYDGINKGRAMTFKEYENWLENGGLGDTKWTTDSRDQLGIISSEGFRRDGRTV